MKVQRSKVKGQRFLICLLATCYLLLATPAWAGEDLNTIISHLQKTYEGISDIKALFHQETASSTLKETQHSEGIVYFKKPGMMRWEYKTPVKDLIVSDGNTLWIYQPDLRQVMVGRAEDQGLVKNLLAGVGGLKEEFDITLEGDKGPNTSGKGDSYLLRLHPRIPQPNIKGLQMVVDKKTFLVAKVIAYDPFGNITTVSFEKVKTNQSLSPQLFHFEIPEGVEVVRPN